jgi:hypothetical protein
MQTCFSFFGQFGCVEKICKLAFEARKTVDLIKHRRDAYSYFVPAPILQREIL